MAGSTFCREVLAAQILVSNRNFENVIYARVFLWPQIRSMAGETDWAILVRMLDLVAADALGSQALELPGGERAACALRFVAFDAFDDGMFAGQSEFCVSIMDELELADGPGGWDGMALNAPGIQLASVRVFVTICAF